MNSETDENYRSRCPLASALDLLGDKWTLVIVRDMIMDKRRFGDFQSSPEGIPTNILAGRLRRLEKLGIVERRAYQDKPVRYEYFLTRKGAELLPVIQQLVVWACRHVPGRWAPAARFLAATPDDLLHADRPPP